MSKPKPMPELGRCPYCRRRLKIHFCEFFPQYWFTRCPNDACPTRNDYATERGAINAANRRVK